MLPSAFSSARQQDSMVGVRDVQCNWAIPFAECTLETCCLDQSFFAYRPSLGGNLFYALFFALSIIPQVYLGIRYKTWSFMVGMLAGLVSEVVGYSARVGLFYDPFDSTSFLLYLIFITIAPSFMAAAMYICLSRIFVLFGKDLLVLLGPRTIAILFMVSDVVALSLQAVGGAIAYAAFEALDLNAGLEGIDIMVAGLLSQAISLACFALVWGAFMLRVRLGSPDPSPQKLAVRRRTFFYAFSGSLLLATVLIITRSVFRVIELWGGFEGPVWNDEVDFMVLDGSMVALTVTFLTVFHPGPAFRDEWKAANWEFRRPTMRTSTATRTEATGQQQVIYEDK